MASEFKRGSAIGLLAGAFIVPAISGYLFGLGTIVVILVSAYLFFSK